MTEYRYCQECETSIDHLSGDDDFCEECFEELNAFEEATGREDQEYDEWKERRRGLWDD